MTTASIAKHDVRVVIGGRQIGGWTNYSIRTSMIQPADSFTLERPFDRAAFDLLAPDSTIQVLVDGVALVTGYLDDRDKAPDGLTISITGRDKVGHLVQEAIPRIDYRGLGVRELVKKLAHPWFTEVTLSNERNRRVIRGKGKRVPSGNEPVTVDTPPKQAGTRLEPGQMRWSAIEELLRQAGWIGWSSGDGRELVIGKPNYRQAVQWRFFLPKSQSRRSVEGNVVGMGLKDSVGDRYSSITVVGSGCGTDVNYGIGVTQRAGVAKDGPGADGIGGDFQYPKRLVLVEKVKSRAEAERFAKRELARRAVGGHPITVRAPLHGQRVAGDRLTLFAPDTLATVEDEATGRRGVYLVTGCSFATDRTGGEVTDLDLVPKGTELTL